MSSIKKYNNAPGFAKPNFTPIENYSLKFDRPTTSKSNPLTPNQNNALSKEVTLKLSKFPAK